MDYKYNYSIIIPHKNTPDLLKRCLDSIPRRTDVQIIVVDDNSDEDKVDFRTFPGLNEENVDVVFSKKGKGAGGARNDGLKLAKGKWLLFADADDYYNEGFLDVLDDYIQSSYDIVFFLVSSNVQGRYDRSIKMNHYYIQCLEGKKSFEEIKFLNWCPVNKMFSANLINSNRIQFEEIPVGNDAFFSFRAIEKGINYKLIPNKLYCVTYYPKSITYAKRPFQRQMDDLDISLRINDFLGKHGLSKYQGPIFTPKTMLWIFDYGFKDVYHYFKTISERFSVLRCIYIYIRDKVYFLIKRTPYS